jgi:hypothetical protein
MDQLSNKLSEDGILIQNTDLSRYSRDAHA